MRRETYGGSGCSFVKMLRLDEHKTVVLAVHSAGRWPQCESPSTWNGLLPSDRAMAR